MNSLEWRVKKLENKILGQSAGLANVDRIISQTGDHESILEQLNTVARQYRGYIDGGGGKHYPRFMELYDKYRNLLSELDQHTTSENNETSKAELVLAYEDDLVKYMQDIKNMAEKADRVLNIDKWPDFSGYQGRLDKLQEITKEQHIQSISLDKKTEELIGIYNDIIGSFKSNIDIWNQKLEAYENADKKSEDDL